MGILNLTKVSSGWERIARVVAAHALDSAYGPAGDLDDRCSYPIILDHHFLVGEPGLLSGRRLLQSRRARGGKCARAAEAYLRALLWIKLVTWRHS